MSRLRLQQKNGGTQLATAIYVQNSGIKNIVDLPREMFEVNVATLVIWGELDQALLLGNLDGLEDYVDELVIKRIPDGTHWVVHEKPELISSLIREFV